MRIIGITGGIGSGKSAVLDILKRETGCFVVDADKLAHRLMEPGESIYICVVNEFGTDILKEDKSIDRVFLGKLVFGSEEKLRKLNSLVHPGVKEYILTDIENKRKEGFEKYVIEAALLIEDGYRLICDEIWYVYADRETRIHRLMEGRQGTREKWESIINNQFSDDYYRSNCDYVIDNSKNMEKTEYIVKELLCKSR